MIVKELIAALSKLPQDHEIAILTASAHACPPVIERVRAGAWTNEVAGSSRGGLGHPDRAFLIRPKQDVL